MPVYKLTPDRRFRRRINELKLEIERLENITIYRALTDDEQVDWDTYNNLLAYNVDLLTSYSYRLYSETVDFERVH